MWAIAVAIFWLGLIGLCEWIEPPHSSAPSLCKLKAITGIPCPTCGATRAVKAIAVGRFVEGWLHNPLVVTAMTAGGAFLLIRLSTGWTITLSASRRTRALLWIAIAILLTGNWIYLIARGV